MSVRVNLLPRATKEGARSSRQRVIAGVVALLVLAGLATATLLQRGTLSDAEDELALAQSELVAAQSAVQALSEYAELERRQQEIRSTVAVALGDQVSLAGVLQDLALVMPADADLGTLSIALAPPAESDPRGIVGSITASGESIDGIAPGIERLIRSFEQASGFEDVFVSTAAVDDEDITSYNLEVLLGPEHRTERYSFSDEEGTE